MTDFKHFFGVPPSDQNVLATCQSPRFKSRGDAIV